jgi:hypothetical protein
MGSLQQLLARIEPTAGRLLPACCNRLVIRSSSPEAGPGRWSWPPVRRSKRQSETDIALAHDGLTQQERNTQQKLLLYIHSL